MIRLGPIYNNTGGRKRTTTKCTCQGNRNMERFWILLNKIINKCQREIAPNHSTLNREYDL